MPFGCTICFVTLEKSPTSEGVPLTQTVGITAAPCGHVFHTVCIMQWINCGEGCPYCRKGFVEEELQELFYNRLDDESPVISDDVNVEEETDPGTLRSWIRNLKLNKLENESIIKNLRAELSRVNSRWSLERSKAETQRDHLRLSLRNVEVELTEAQLQRQRLRIGFEDSRRRVEDLECVIVSERCEASREIERLKKRNAELELESLRLLEEKESLSKKVKELRDIDQLVSRRVEKRLIQQGKSGNGKEDSDCESVYSVKSCQLMKGHSSPRQYSHHSNIGSQRRRQESDLEEEDIITRPKSRVSEKKRPMVIESDTEPESSSDESIRRLTPRKKRRLMTVSHSYSSRRSRDFRRNLRSYYFTQIESRPPVPPFGSSFLRRCNRRIESDYSD